MILAIFESVEGLSQGKVSDDVERGIHKPRNYVYFTLCGSMNLLPELGDKEMAV